MSDNLPDKKPDSPATKRPRKVASVEGTPPADLSAEVSSPPVGDAAVTAPADASDTTVTPTAAPVAFDPPAAEPAKPQTDAAAAASAFEKTEAVPPTAGAEAAAGPQKGTTIMATEKVQAVFGDLNDRAKTAMQKSSKFVEEMTDLTKGNVEAIVASSRVAAKGAETLGQEAVEYGKKSFETASATFKSFASVKSPSEFYQLQSDYAKTAFDSAITEASKVSEQLVKLTSEIFQPISTRYSVAMEKLKATAL